MKPTYRFILTLTLALVFLCLLGCPGVFPGGMTGTTTPAPCSVDADCGDGIACIFPNGTDQPGICDVDETEVSTGTPAPCNADEDCPEGIDCIFPNGTDQEGFCDIDEMLAP